MQMKKFLFCVLLPLVILVACGRDDDKTGPAIAALRTIVNATIADIDAATAGVKEVKDASGAVAAVDRVRGATAGMLAKIAALQNDFPEKQLDLKRLGAVADQIREQARLAGERFAEALQDLPADILAASEFRAACEKLQDNKP